jgi:hypothetical protein
VLFFLWLQLFHRLCFLLDDLLFPAWRHQEVEAPVFILGPPRSGTTFLHRLLASDREHFTAMTLGEILFAPAICEKHLLDALDRLDLAFGQPLRWAYNLLRNHLTGSLDPIHKVDLLQPEEDEFLMVHLWKSALQMLLVPAHPDHMKFFYFDRDVNPGERTRIMDFYRDMVQRHLYARGKGRHFLSKNPSFAAKVATLHEVFPDARLIVLLRTPEEVVPSLLSLTASVGKLFAIRDLSSPPHRDLAQDFLIFLYHHPADLCPLLFGGSWAEVRYRALLTDLVGELEEIYSMLGLTMGEDFAQRVAIQGQASKHHRSRHHYSLEDFDVDPEEFEDRFQSVFERFGFSPPSTRT